MAVNNATILGSMYLQGSNDYQQLVPDPTQASVALQAQAIFAPNNTRIYNMFMDNFVNRIGRSFVSQNKEWNNPLAVFEKGDLPFGFSVQETALKWIKAHNYDDSKETLLKLHRPEAQTCYHSLDFQQYYPISINRTELEQAFMDDYGLNALIDSIMIQPMNSANYDLYNTAVQLIAEADEMWGLWKENITAITDKASGQAFLAKARAYAGKMRFPSCLYNAGIVTDIPVFSRREDLVLLVTPDVKANLDVYALADLFNMEVANVEYRTIEVREFPIPGVQAMLCDEGFFQFYNKIWDMESWYNPETLCTNHYLHCWKILSMSPFANCVLFTTGTGSSATVKSMSLSGITLSTDATSDTIAAGGTCKISVALTGQYEEGINLVPKSVTYIIESEDAPLNSRTYVDRNGVLHTQKTLESGDELKVTATSTYINPSGETTVLTDDITIYIDNAPEVKFSSFKLPVGVSGALVDGVIDHDAGTIAVDAVAETVVTSLAATFTVGTGDKVYVGSTEQTSGTTTNNYTNPVKFKVTHGADAKLYKEYTVTVTVAE